MKTTFNLTRRSALKTIAGVTAGSVIGGFPAMAASAANRQAVTQLPAQKIDCKLICREDNTRAYLLMQNRTDDYVSVSSFTEQRVRFAGNSLNMKDAYKETTTIAPQDRVMVRLQLPDTHINFPQYQRTTDFEQSTSFLPQGTRVVDAKMSISGGVATLIGGGYT